MNSCAFQDIRIQILATWRCRNAIASVDGVPNISGSATDIPAASDSGLNGMTG